MKYLLLGIAIAFAITACSGGKEEAAETLDPQSLALTVYKSPTCLCCADWVEHVEEQGFPTTVNHPENMNAIKQELGLAPQYGSCHTAVNKDGYLFEGHIPAKTMREFLRNPPKDALGLAVPGMPLGSPGMEIDERFTPYAVLLLKKDGSAEEFRRFETAAEQY